jgi:hypothetical protein
MNHATIHPAADVAPAGRAGAAPLPSELRERVEALFSRAGLTQAARELGISEATLARVLARARVSNGTVASIRLALGQSPR